MKVLGNMQAEKLREVLLSSCEQGQGEKKLKAPFKTVEAKSVKQGKNRLDVLSRGAMTISNLINKVNEIRERIGDSNLL